MKAKNSKILSISKSILGNYKKSQNIRGEFSNNFQIHNHKFDFLTDLIFFLMFMKYTESYLFKENIKGKLIRFLLFNFGKNSCHRTYPTIFHKGTIFCTLDTLVKISPTIKSKILMNTICYQIPSCHLIQLSGRERKRI